jgi:GNAT superfamily N-acetyltransferase
MPEEVICSRILRDKEQLKIKMATPPLSKSLINAFLRTPELSATRHESRKRLFGGLRGQSLDYFFAGELGEKIVGTCWYCTPATCKEIAYMGELFTNKKQRNKGVATSLLEVTMDFFRKEGRRAFYVTNLCPRAPHAIYSKLGFQAYGYGQQAYGGLIRLVVDGRSEDFDRDYYRYDPKTTIRTVNWGDLPHFIALLNYPHEWIVRAYNFGLIGPVVFDELGRAFMVFMKTLKADNICLVLEDGNRRVVGTAYSSSPPAGSQSHVKIVDFLVHPNYYAEAPRLLKMLIEELSHHEAEKLQAYAAATDNSKVKILRLCEFKKEATMRNQLRIGSKIDLEIYSYGLHDQDLQTDRSYYPLS